MSEVDGVPVVFCCPPGAHEHRPCGKTWLINEQFFTPGPCVWFSQSWIHDLQAATNEYVARILRGDPPPCEHRYCHDQGYAMCMGVAGAQIDMLEESGMSRREAVGRVVAGWWGEES